MTTREQILWKIAELYQDLVDPINGRAGIPGDGDSLGLMPNTYTPTVKEYERLLKLMRDDRHEPLLDNKLSVRAAWWHLEHWHHRATRVIRHHPVTAKRGRNTVTLLNPDGSKVTRPTLAYLRDPKADEAKAKQAITWIAAHWDHKRLGEPTLHDHVTDPIERGGARQYAAA